MEEWHINDEISYLHKIITCAMTGSVAGSSLFRRLFGWSIISLFNQINTDLEKLKGDLEMSIKLEGVSIDFNTYLDMEYWNDNFLFQSEEKLYRDLGVDIKKISYSFQINTMIDYMPIDEEGYHVTQDLIDTFKNSMHQLCDFDKFGDHEFLYTLHFALCYMLHLLKDIKEMVEHPKPHQYKKVWDEIYEKNSNIKCRESYLLWKEDTYDYKFTHLKNQQLKQIFILLDSGFFRFDESIIGADIKNRKLIITEDNLPVGYTISEKLPAECAKFEKYFKWKGGDVLSLDYEKLGQYIYRNYSKLTPEDSENIVIFDKTLDQIHEDMAEMKPKLKEHLKNYEENMANELLNKCTEILNTCQVHLAKGIRPSFLKEYLKKLLFDKDMKDEARKALSGGSIKTYMCKIVAALKNAHVFKVECDKHDLANSLHEYFTGVLSETLAKNIERAFNANEGALHHWTLKIVPELKEKPENIFEGIKWG